MPILLTNQIADRWALSIRYFNYTRWWSTQANIPKLLIIPTLHYIQVYRDVECEHFKIILEPTSDKQLVW